MEPIDLSEAWATARGESFTVYVHRLQGPSYRDLVIYEGMSTGPMAKKLRPITLGRVVWAWPGTTPPLLTDPHIKVGPAHYFETFAEAIAEMKQAWTREQNQVVHELMVIGEKIKALEEAQATFRTYLTSEPDWTMREP